MKRIIFCLAFILFFCTRGHSIGIWVDLNINITISNLNSVYAVTNSNVWAGGFLGHVIHTTDEGLTWSEHGILEFGTMEIYALSAIDSQTVLVAVHNANPQQTYIFKTTNGGQLWFPAFSQQTGWIDDIKMINATSGFAYGDPVGGRWTLLRTNNGGTSWDSTGMYLPETNGNKGWLNAMTVYYTGFNAPVIWFGTAQGLVYKSSDGGFTWASQPIPMNGDVFCLAFSDANTGFCGSDNAVCGTTNGGANWNLLSAPGGGQVNSFIYNSGQFWYARNMDIFFSTNSGGNFNLQHSTPAGIYQHMSFVFSANNNTQSTIGGWAITGKNIISHYKDQNIGIQQISSNVPSKFKLEQNYPNPFNPSTKIRFDIPHISGNQNIVLTIYDITGKEVSRPVNQSLSPGTYEMQWPEGSGISSGIYFYRLNYSNYSETKKMVMIK